jgi:hypothetical protein
MQSHAAGMRGKCAGRRHTHPARHAGTQRPKSMDGGDIRSILVAFPTREILNFHRVLIAIFGCKLPNVGQLLVKNPYIVLSQKEQDLARVRKEVQALLTAIPLLLADDQYSADNVSQELLLAISRNDLEPLARHLRNSSSQKR